MVQPMGWRTGALLLLLIGGCDDARCFDEVFAEHRRELDACEPGDTCVALGTSCRGSINAEQLDLYQSLLDGSKRSGCGVNDCFCEATNPRCEQGRCVADCVPFQ
jgi:hypothetical protein